MAGSGSRPSSPRADEPSLSPEAQTFTDSSPPLAHPHSWGHWYPNLISPADPSPVVPTLGFAAPYASRSHDGSPEKDGEGSATRLV